MGDRWSLEWYASQYTIDLVQCTCRHKVNRLSGTGSFICGPRESNTERESTEHSISRC